jgi:hypothetical protein
MKIRILQTSRSPESSESNRLVPTASSSSIKMMAPLFPDPVHAISNLHVATPTRIGNEKKKTWLGLLFCESKSVTNQLCTVSDEHLNQLWPCKLEKARLPRKFQSQCLKTHRIPTNFQTCVCAAHARAIKVFPVPGGP